MDKMASIRHLRSKLQVVSCQLHHFNRRVDEIWVRFSLEVDLVNFFWDEHSGLKNTVMVSKFLKRHHFFF